MVEEAEDRRDVRDSGPNATSTASLKRWKTRTRRRVHASAESGDAARHLGADQPLEAPSSPAFWFAVC
jgi:hypothetical protein